MSQKDSPIKYVPLRDVYDYVDVIYNQLRKSGIKPTQIIGVQLGGLVPAMLLAKRFGIREINTISETNLSVEYRWVLAGPPSNKGVNLIVDDLVDSGKTMVDILSNIYTSFPTSYLMTAVLIHKTTSEMNPDFIGMKTKDPNWILFPWEWNEREHI